MMHLKPVVALLLEIAVAALPRVCSAVGVGQIRDTSSVTNVYGSVTQYFESLATSPVDTVIDRVDRLVAAVQDKDVASRIAALAFDYFSDSPVMGQEAVAVHVADSWFLNKRLDWPYRDTYPQLYTYAEFNRSSLVGKDAGELVMKDDRDATVSLRNLDGDFKLLYFFDDQCSSCRRETPRLASLLRSYSGLHLTAVLIYTQTDRDAWLNYVNENFGDIDNPDVSIVTLWDPEAENGYHVKYGVLTTPQMFLLDSQNVIIGRRLDCDALCQLLEVENGYFDRSFRLLDACFDDAGSDAAEYAVEMADAYFIRYSADTSVFRSAFHDLLGYLRDSRDYELQQAAVVIAEKYVTGHPEYWSAEYVARIARSIAATRLNPLCEKPSDLLLSDENGRRCHLLDRCVFDRRRTLILFHLVTCGECGEKVEEMIADAETLRREGYRVKLVYVGSDGVLWHSFVDDVRTRGGSLRGWSFLWDPDGTSRMRELYDLQYVPHLYALDSRDRLFAKDVPVGSLTVR